MGRARQRTDVTTTAGGRSGFSLFGTGTWHGSWFEQQVIPILAVILIASTIATPAIQSAVGDLEERIGDALSSEAVAPGAVPEGLTAEEWADIQAQIAALQSSQTLDPQVTVEPVAPPTLRLGRFADASFATAGATYTFDDHTVRLGTVSVGGPILAAAPEIDGDRVVYDRGPIEEWFVETGRGVQQGWTIAEAPAGVTDELVIEVSVRSALVPVPVSPDTVALVDEAGDSVASYSGLLAWDAAGTDLPASMTVVADRIAITVDVTGATYPVTVDPLFAQEQTFGVFPNAAFDRHGSALAVDMNAVDGPVAVIGTPGSDQFGGDTGAVTVLRRDGAGDWNVEAQLRSDPLLGAGANFNGSRYGVDVTVLDTQIAVGSPGVSFNGANSGAVHTYDFDGTDWLFGETVYQCDDVNAPCGLLIGEGGGMDFRFGEAVDFGTAGELVISAPGTGSDEGAVYVYRDTGGEFELQAGTDLIKNPTANAGEEFGADVDADAFGNLAIGAPGANGGDGSVYWSLEVGGIWQVDELPPSGSALSSAAIGEKVVINEDIDGTVVIVGSGSNPSSENTTLFWSAPAGTTPSANLDVLETTLTDPGNPAPGAGGVDFDGSTFFLGTPRSPGAGLPSVVSTAFWNAGSDTVSFVGGESYSVPVGDGMGLEVAIAGADAIFASPLETIVDSIGASNAEAGVVRIRELNDLDPIDPTTEQTSFSVPAADFDGLGFSVAIDGNLMAVGAPGASNLAVGSGAVHVFTRPDVASTWVLQSVVGFDQPFAQFGYSVDVHEASGRVLVGAPAANTIRILEPDGPRWEITGPAVIGSGRAGHSVAFGLDENHIVFGSPDAPVPSGGVGRVDQAVLAGAVPAWTVTTVAEGPATAADFGFAVDAAVEPGNVLVVVGDPNDTSFTNGRVSAFSVDSTQIGVASYTQDLDVLGTDNFGLDVAITATPDVADSGVIAAASADTVVVYEGGAAGFAADTPTTYDPPVAQRAVDINASRVAVLTDDRVEVYVRQSSGTIVTSEDQFRPVLGYAGFEADVAIDDGTTIVLGEPRGDASGPDAGQLYITNIPVLPVYGEPSVDIDGVWAAYGVPEDDVVYVLERSSGSWALRDTITGTAGSSFGAAVSIDERALLVGAPGDDAAGVDAGAAFQYVRNIGESTFTAVGRLDGLQSAGSLFGSAVDQVDNDAFVGAPGQGATVGSVSVFALSGIIPGSVLGTLDQTLPGLAGGDEHGAALATAVFGPRRVLVIGAPGIASEGGVARVYLSINGGAYGVSSTLSISVAAGDRVGDALDVSHITFDRLGILVGAPGENEAYYALIDPGGAFEQVTPISPLTGAAAGLGSSVSMAGDRLLVGSDSDVYVLLAKHESLDTVTTTGTVALDPTITGVAIEGTLGLAVPPSAGIAPIDLSGSQLRQPEVLRNTFEDYPADKLFSPFASDDDGFGIVAADGDTVVVGAPNAPQDFFGTGRVYVFTSSGGGNFTLSQELVPTTANNRWGTDVAIAGNVLVGIDASGNAAWYTRPNASAQFSLSGGGPTPGATSVATDGQTLVIGDVQGGNAYVREGGPAGWPVNPLRTLPGPGFGFGRDVAVDGNIIYVSDTPNAVSGQVPGEVDVYVNEGGGTIEYTGITLQGAQGGVDSSDSFGIKLDVTPGRLIVGASYDNDRSGAAYIFECSEPTPATVSCGAGVRLDGGGFQGGEFGHDVQIDGDLALVSARMSGGITFSTDSILFRNVNGTWQRTTQLFDAPDADAIDQYRNLALTEDWIVLGAQEEDAFGADAGAVMVFPVPDPNEVVNTTVYRDGFLVSDFAQTVAVDGDTMVVGDPLAGTNGSGLAYVFERTPDGVWQFEAELDGGFATGAQSGSSVAVQGDTIVIGAPFHIGASNGGIAVFDFTGGSWTQNGGILTSLTGGGSLGQSVAIDGDIVVAGQPGLPAQLAGGGVSPGEPSTGGLAVFSRPSPGAAFTFDTDLFRAPDSPDEFIGFDVAIDGTDIYSVALTNSGTGVVDRWTPSAHVSSAIGPFGALTSIDVAASAVAVTDLAGGVWLLDRALATPTPVAAVTGGQLDVAFDGTNLVVVSGANEVLGYVDGGASWVLDADRTPALIGGSPTEVSLADDGTLAIGVPSQSNARGLLAGSVFVQDVGVAPDNPNLQFNLALGAGQNATVPVAPGGIAIADIDAALLEAAGEGTLAASPLGQTDLADTPLSALSFGETPIPDVIRNNPDLFNLPLIDVELDTPGGWTEILEGSEFADRPLVDIRLGEVLDASVDAAVTGQVVSLPLSALDVNGTPLSALPLSALVLGNIPLSALPLSALGTDLCTVFAEAFPPGTSCLAIEAAVGNLSVTEAALQGLPLSALPLSALPLSALPLSALPLSALPLSALQLEDSPLSALPLSALPLSALGLDSIPLSALPLSALPLSALPLSALGLDSTPLSALPLSALEINGIPLSALEVEGAPLSALPLSALPLSALAFGDEQLSSLPVPAGFADWCDVLADTGAAYNCSVDPDADDQTIVALGLRGVPLSALPLSALPLSALPLSALPLSALPLDSVPLSALPLSALPLSALPLSALPLSALNLTGTSLADIPLSALDIQGSPLSALPLSALPLSALPSALPLSALPLSALPLSALPLSALQVQGAPLSALPLSALDVLSSPLSALPLSALPLSALPLSALDCSQTDCENDTIGDALLAGALDPNQLTLGDIQVALEGIGIGELLPFFFTITAEEIQLAIDGSGLTLLDLLDLSDLTLGDLPLDDPLVADLLLGQLVASLGDISLSDLAAALGLSDTEMEAVLAGFDLADLVSYGDLTLGEALANGDGGQAFGLDQLGVFLGLLDLQQLIDESFGADPYENDVDPSDDETLGDALDLGALTLADLIGLLIPEYDTLTLGELLDQLDASGNLLGFVLADLLAALVGLEDIAFGNVDFAEVEAGSLPVGTVPDVQFRAGFQVTDTANAQSVVVDVELPATATYVPGTAIVNDGVTQTPLEPTVLENGLQWTVFGVDADEPHLITFDVRPEVTIGSTSLNGRGRIVGTDTTIPASAAVTVAEGLEDNDYPATTLVVDDTVYLTYISTTTDIDVFEVTVGERDRLAIQLSSLSADLDLVLYGVPDVPTVGSALTGTSDEAPLSPITNPDAVAADSEPLEDFPRLDQLFPGDGLQLIEVSNGAGTADELIVTDALAAGTYYVQVHGANGARNQMPATLQIQTLEADVRPPCSTLVDILGGPLPAAAPGVLPADLTGNTLFLVNEQRLEQLYGPAGRADVVNSLDALVLYLESNPSFGLDPIVIPVEAYGGVQTAYGEWDDPANADDACDPEVANDVVSAIIANAVDPIRDQLDHVIIVGGDDIIPMARLQDETTIANEYDYRTELVGDLNGGQGDNVSALTASFWEARYLSDDPYGEAAARSLGNRFLYVPDVSLGRLVEAPDEIASALDTFVTFQGTLDMNTAAVLGYDFLVDSSAEISSDLAAAGLIVDDDLADGIDSTDGQPWDRTDAEERLVPPVGPAADLISFNAHFDHYRALPAAGDQVPGFLDNVETSAIENALPSTVLEGTVLFSAGCHGGLSVSDIQIGTTNLDWAQAASQADALWIGNTGFGYGDTETIAYTEQLMALFAEEVVTPLQLPGESAPTTIGQAFTVAKNRFVSENLALSVYDEKASMEAVFYGLPIYRVGIPAEPAPPAPVNAPTPDATGTPALVVTVDADPTAISTSSGVYYAETDAEGNEEIISVPGRPVQPKTSEDVSVVDPADTTRLGQVAHGGLILDMSSEYVSLPDPVIASVVVDDSAEVPEPDVPNSIFPAKPLVITQSTTATGQRQTLSIATGQYRPGAGVQRLDDDIDVNVYYADPAVTDFNAPRIGRVERTVDGGLLTITARVADDANGVDRVYVLLAQDPGIGPVDWDGFDLTQGANPEIWSGSIQLEPGTAGIEFIVQAKDGVGNVGYANDKAGNFGSGTEDTPEPPPPVDLSADFSTDNLDVASGWYTGDVVITVTTDGAAGYSVDGEPFQPIASGDSFTVTGDGIHTVEIETPAGERIAKLVRIDTTGFPEFTAGTPVAFGSYSNDLNNVFDFLCTDPSLVSCDASVDGTPVEVGDPLPITPGTYVLTVETVDALGNDATYTVPFDITAPLDNLPEITLLEGPTVPELISDGVTIDITFGDADGVFDDYTVDIDWGDYDDDDTPGSSTICSTSSGSPTPGNPSCEITAEPTGAAADGTATASFVYPEPGVYAIEVTVTDGAGNTDTSVFEFAVVYDPEAGRVSGAGWYWSGPEAYAEEEPWGGPAFFGYRARYRGDETTPRGRTKLHLVGEFFFRSTAYDYLIVNDTLAVAEGVGKIGGQSGYRFRVQGIDNGRLDFFQITIWDDVTGDIVYDNGILYDEGDVVLLGGIRVRS